MFFPVQSDVFNCRGKESERKKGERKEVRTEIIGSNNIDSNNSMNSTQ